MISAIDVAWNPCAANLVVAAETIEPRR